MTGRDTARRRDAERRGRRSEFLAMVALVLKGYRPLAWRAKTPLGEVDLIVRRGDVIAFVEVKARRSISEAIDAVSPSARRRILAAGELWLSRHPRLGQVSWRCDIVAVRPWRWPVHLENAF